MKSLIRVVAVAGCLLAWRAECQYQPEGGGSGLYVTPAYSGDNGVTYVSPAFNGGGAEAGPTPGAGGAALFGAGGERGTRERPRYESPDSGAYTTPAFSAPVLGLRMSPPSVPKAKPKSGAGDSKANPPAGDAPAKSSGISEKQPDGGGMSTNRLENPISPPAGSTNAPPGQGAAGPL